MGSSRRRRRRYSRRSRRRYSSRRYYGCRAVANRYCDEDLTNRDIGYVRNKYESLCSRLGTPIPRYVYGQAFPRYPTVNVVPGGGVGTSTGTPNTGSGILQNPTVKNKWESQATDHPPPTGPYQDYPVPSTTLGVPQPIPYYTTLPPYTYSRRTWW